MADRIGIIGHGRFGRALGDLFAETGREVSAWDPAGVDGSRSAPTLEDVIDRGDVIVFAVPIAAMRGAMERARPHVRSDQLVLDVGSVKVLPSRWMAEVFGVAVSWVATHPLFGPTSLMLGERPLRVVVCPTPGRPEAGQRARALYTSCGCEVVEQDADTHDRVMAETHALAYFVAKGILDAGVNLESEHAPPSSQAILRTVEAVRSDAGHLFAALHVDNPYAAQARQRFLEALTAIDRTLLSTDPGEEAMQSDAFAIPDLGERSNEIREVRDLIDDVDREIIALLARRSLLARRAGRAKAGLGVGVRDARREAALLSDRRTWAEDNGIDPDVVEGLFQEVVRYSRHLQQRGETETGV